MNVSSERSRSLWMATAPKFGAPRLDRDEEADAVVVGSGIAGLSIAYELAATGLNVVALDRGPIGRGMTARTSGHLTWATDDEFSRLISIHGAKKARLFYDSHSAAIDQIESIQSREAIACGFARVDGYLFSPDAHDKSLAKELRAMRSLGIDQAEEIDRVPTLQGDRRALRFHNQAQFHVLHYLNGLAHALKVRGARLYAETTGCEIREARGGVVVKTTDGHSVRARSCIIATNAPVVVPTSVHEKQKPYRTYVMAMPIARDHGEDALIWDTLDPYHYVRFYKDADGGALLIIGGEDHPAAEADDMSVRFEHLEAWARRHFPDAGAPTHRWSGQVLEPIDCLAFIGRRPGNKHIYFVTGDSGEGLTHGVVASLVIRDLIVEGDSPWAALYSPARRPAKAPATFHRERSKSAVKPAKKPAVIKDSDELGAEEGAIMKRGGEEIAIYKDGAGAVHEFSAKCTHLGCTVQWNSFEGCWDCPCHGSQFAADGSAVNAPAVKALSPAKPKGKRRGDTAVRSPAANA